MRRAKKAMPPPSSSQRSWTGLGANAHVIIFCDHEVKELLSRNENQILEELNVKSVSFVEHQNELIEYQLKPNFKILGQKFGDQMGRIIGIINQNKNTFLQN